MANSFVAWRAQLVFALCLPLAVLLGYMLSEPGSFSSMAVFAIVFGVLSMPLLMYWYHPLLIITWNAAISPIFLPGQPFIWMLFAFLGFGIAIVNRFTNSEARFVDLPSMNRSLIFLLIAVLVTAYIRGGLGVRSMGSGQYGGKGYYYIMAAILGYFALISQRIPKQRASLFVALFFLSGLTSLVPNLAWLGGRGFEFLFYLFPPSYAWEQASAEFSGTAAYSRLYGLTFASNGLYCWLLARYGLRGIFDLAKPVRLLLFILAALGCLYCGFRSFMLLFVFTLVAQFFAEKLYRERVVVVLGACALIFGAATFQYTDKLPLVIQRSISFLPVRLNPVVKQTADLSTEWRVNMWKDVLPLIPKYLVLGKGYGIEANQVDLAEGGYRGFGPSYSAALTFGAYHNGPLTLIVPFGIWAFGAFAWFCLASIRYLYRNFRYGDPDMKVINTFLLAYFIARLVYFSVIFGNFFSDLFAFTGIIGLSVGINGARLFAAEEPEPVADVAREEGLTPSAAR